MQEFSRPCAHGFIPFLVSAVATMLISSCVVGPTVRPAPSPEKLQAGDLIWPKPPGAFVPYAVQSFEGSTGNPKQWQTEKEHYLASLKAKPALSSVERARYNTLEQITYSDFAQQYFAPLPSHKLTANTRGFEMFYVGHVGIIQIENSVPVVIEAMMGVGVQKAPFDKWIGNRTGQLFWVSRLKDTSAEKRAAVAVEAERYLRKPYNFLNSNLKDDSCFYCSKLAWLAIYNVTKVHQDDDPNGNRVLWYSPKQLLGSRHLQSIVSSGNYTHQEQQ